MFARLFRCFSFSSSFDEQYPFFPLEVVFTGPVLVVYNVAYTEINANMTACAFFFLYESERNTCETYSMLASLPT